MIQTNKCVLSLAAAAMVVSTAACSSMGKMGGGSSSSSDTVSAQSQSIPQMSREFLRTSAGSHMFEIQASEHVSGKSTTAEVKRFADQMIRDHRSMLDSTRQLAKQYNVDIPATMTPDFQRQMSELQAASGTELDQTYARIMEASHQQTMLRLKNHIDNTDFAPTRDLARTSLSRVESHHQMAQGLNANMMDNESERNPATVDSSTFDSTMEDQPAQDQPTQTEPLEETLAQ